MHPLRYIAEPEDVASVVAFLLRPEARAVTGAVYAVDCGLSARFAADLDRIFRGAVRNDGGRFGAVGVA